MIPKVSNSPSNPDFNNFIKQLRAENSAANTNRVEDFKTSFQRLIKETDEVEQAIVASANAAHKNTEVIIDALEKNANTIKRGMIENGVPPQLVEITYEQLRESVNSRKELENIRIQLGGQGGIFQIIGNFLKSFLPFSTQSIARAKEKREERRHKATGKLMKLTFREQENTTAAIDRLYMGLVQTPEEIKEDRKWWEKLFGIRDKNKWTKGDQNDFQGGSLWEKMKDFSPLIGALGFVVGGLLASPFIILTSYIQRGKWMVPVSKFVLPHIKSMFSGLFGLTEKIFVKSAGGIGKILDTVVSMLGLGDNIDFNAAEDLTKAAKGKFTKLRGFFKGVGGFLETIRLYGMHLGDIFRGGSKAASGAKVFGESGKAIRFIVGLLKGMGKIGVYLAKFSGLARLIGNAAKFVPFVNIIIGVYEVFRGMIKGFQKIGGVKGVLIGLLGGIAEFFTLGIFDIGSFLDKAKEVLEGDGGVVSKILGVAKAFFVDGLGSGIAWLGKKMFELLGLSEGGGITDDTGLLGKILYWTTWPHRKLLEGLMTVGEFIQKDILNMMSGVVSWFGKIIHEVSQFTDNPLDWIQKYVHSLFVPKSIQAAADVNKGIATRDMNQSVYRRNGISTLTGIDRERYNEQYKRFLGEGNTSYDAHDMAMEAISLSKNLAERRNRNDYLATSSVAMSYAANSRALAPTPSEATAPAYRQGLMNDSNRAQTPPFVHITDTNYSNQDYSFFGNNIAGNR